MEKKESPKGERAVKPVISLPSEKWVLKIGQTSEQPADFFSCKKQLHRDKHHSFSAQSGLKLKAKFLY